METNLTQNNTVHAPSHAVDLGKNIIEAYVNISEALNRLGAKNSPSFEQIVTYLKNKHGQQSEPDRDVVETALAGAAKDNPQFKPELSNQSVIPLTRCLIAVSLSFLEANKKEVLFSEFKSKLDHILYQELHLPNESLDISRDNISDNLRLAKLRNKIEVVQISPFSVLSSEIKEAYTAAQGEIKDKLPGIDDIKAALLQIRDTADISEDYLRRRCKKLGLAYYTDSPAEKRTKEIIEIFKDLYTHHGRNPNMAELRQRVQELGLDFSDKELRKALYTSRRHRKGDTVNFLLGKYKIIYDDKSLSEVVKDIYINFFKKHNIPPTSIEIFLKVAVLSPSVSVVAVTSAVEGFRRRFARSSIHPSQSTINIGTLSSAISKAYSGGQGIVRLSYDREAADAGMSPSRLEELLMDLNKVYGGVNLPFVFVSHNKPGPKKENYENHDEQQRQAARIINKYSLATESCYLLCNSLDQFKDLVILIRYLASIKQPNPILESSKLDAQSPWFPKSGVAGISFYGDGVEQEKVFNKGELQIFDGYLNLLNNLIERGLVTRYAVLEHISSLNWAASQKEVTQIAGGFLKVNINRWLRIPFKPII